MQTYPIPPASLQRLQTAYAQFEQLVMVVAEAMGLDPNAKMRLDLQGKQFVIEDEAPNGLVPHAEVENVA